MKKILYLTLLGLIIVALLIYACFEKGTKNNLIIGNKSSEIIGDITIQRVGKIDVMDSKLKYNQHCYFDMGIQNNCTYKIKFKDISNHIVHSKIFSSNFSENEISTINIFKDDKGKWSLILEK